MIIEYPITLSDNGLLDSPTIGNPKEEWIGDRLAHGAGKMVRDTIRRLHRP